MSADGSLRTEPVAEFDPHDPSITAENLHPRYAELRARCPVARGSKYGGYWIATGYEEVRDAALAPDTFSSASGIYLPAISKAERLPLVEMDGAEHAAFRKVLAPRFNAVVAARFEPRTREIINGLVDEFVERGQADLITDLAMPLPLLVIGEQFGLTQEDLDQARTDALSFLDLTQSDWDDEEARVRALDEAMQTIIGRWERIAARRRVEPSDDLLTVLVNADFGEFQATDRQLAWLMYGLTFAGHDSTLLALGNILWHLGEHPDQRAALAADRSLLPAAVEELLRLLAPLHNFRRDTLADTRLGDEDIRAGEPLLLAWGAANRDPRKFEDPDVADFSRDNAKEHLAFGIGKHACIGQYLARVELVAALDIVLDRLGDYAPAGPAVRIGLNGGGHHHGVHELPVSFTPGPRLH